LFDLENDNPKMGIKKMNVQYNLPTTDLIDECRRYVIQISIRLLNPHLIYFISKLMPYLLILPANQYDSYENHPNVYFNDGCMAV